MIRYIDLTDQIVDGEFCFAWYDTVTDTFDDILCVQVWFTWASFERDMMSVGNTDIDRYRDLFPKEVTQQHEAATAAAGGSEI